MSALRARVERVRRLVEGQPGAWVCGITLRTCRLGVDPAGRTEQAGVDRLLGLCGGGGAPVAWLADGDDLVERAAAHLGTGRAVAGLRSPRGGPAPPAFDPRWTATLAGVSADLPEGIDELTLVEQAREVDSWTPERGLRAGRAVLRWVEVSARGGEGALLWRPEVRRPDDLVHAVARVARHARWDREAGPGRAGHGPVLLGTLAAAALVAGLLAPAPGPPGAGGAWPELPAPARLARLEVPRGRPYGLAGRSVAHVGRFQREGDHLRAMAIAMGARPRRVWVEFELPELDHALRRAQHRSPDRDAFLFGDSLVRCPALRVRWARWSPA